MKAQEHNDTSLFRALEANGWVWQGGRLYPPNRTFWFRGAEFPRHVVPDLYMTMKAGLESMPGVKHLYPDQEQFEKWMEDTESLVAILAELVESNNVPR